MYLFGHNSIAPIGDFHDTPVDMKPMRTILTILFALIVVTPTMVSAYSVCESVFISRDSYTIGVADSMTGFDPRFQYFKLGEGGGGTVWRAVGSDSHSFIVKRYKSWPFLLHDIKAFNTLRDLGINVHFPEVLASDNKLQLLYLQDVRGISLVDRWGKDPDVSKMSTEDRRLFARYLALVRQVTALIKTLPSYQIEVSTETFLMGSFRIPNTKKRVRIKLALDQIVPESSTQKFYWIDPL
jgi:hypothetical protein